LVATVDVRLRSSPTNGCENVCGDGGVGGGEVGQAPRTPRPMGAGRRSLLMRRRRRLWGPKETGARGPSPSCDRPASMVWGAAEEHVHSRVTQCPAGTPSSPQLDRRRRSGPRRGSGLDAEISLRSSCQGRDLQRRRAEKLWRLEGRPRVCLPLARGIGPGLVAD